MVLKITGGQFLRLGPQNPVGVRNGLGGSTWHHRKACFEAKHSREELVAVRYANLKLDHFTTEFSGSTKISNGLLGMFNRSMNNIGGCPNQPSLPLAFV